VSRCSTIDDLARIEAVLTSADEPAHRAALGLGNTRR
jgi:hypothetical protein